MGKDKNEGLNSDQLMYILYKLKALGYDKEFRQYLLHSGKWRRIIIRDPYLERRKK
jgi:hypothetical protein